MKRGGRKAALFLSAILDKSNRCNLKYKQIIVVLFELFPEE